MGYSDPAVHPKITRYCSRKPTAVQIAQLERFCQRVEAVRIIGHSLQSRYQVNLYGFCDLRNLFMVDLVLQDIRIYQ
jgi:hypothetical protein